jgi:hypothetical protein
MHAAMRSRLRPILAGLCAIAAAVAVWAAVPGTISGPIVAVDLNGRTITVKDPKVKEITVEVPKDAVIVLDGDEKAILDDVFEGDILKSATLREDRSGKPFVVKAVIVSNPTKNDDRDEK